MNILFVSPYVPNKIRVRPYYWIRHLAERGHQVTLLTVCANDDDRQALDDLKTYCASIKHVDLPTWRSMINCLIALPSREPLQAVYSWDANLADVLYQMATSSDGKGTYDVVHIEHLRGARYGVELISRCSLNKSPLPIIWDSVDSISLLFRQAMVQSKSFLSREITRIELGRTEKYESWLVGEFDQVLVTSKNDKQALLSLVSASGDESQVAVIPNGVDLEYFTPGENDDREKQTIVLSGKMSYHANVSMVVGFIKEIMPHVWSSRPDVQVWIVGKDPSPGIRAFAHHPRVTVTGTVGDIRPFLRKATISASPINYGVGIQNKVLEAMACATPVIASSQAASALTAENGKEIIIADGSLDFADKLISMLDDPEKRELIGKSGRRYVEKEHDWAGRATRLEELYTQSIRQRKPSSNREVKISV
ncbi:MAG: glycosyltransferase [Chloroflexota bacterium]|nr:MAG: glycosyltransferase [Chloroflexota bacterium]